MWGLWRLCEHLRLFAVYFEAMAGWWAVLFNLTVGGFNVTADLCISPHILHSRCYYMVERGVFLTNSVWERKQLDDNTQHAQPLMENCNFWQSALWPEAHTTPQYRLRGNERETSQTEHAYEAQKQACSIDTSPQNPQEPKVTLPHCHWDLWKPPVVSCPCYNW